MKITLEVYQILVPIISIGFIAYAFKQFNDLKNTLFETVLISANDELVDLYIKNKYLS